jgi:hypothetical protein
MKKYYLIMTGGTNYWVETVKAEYFSTHTNDSSSSGYYAFYANGELVACYPINRTAIQKIEKI